MGTYDTLLGSSTRPLLGYVIGILVQYRLSRVNHIYDILRNACLDGLVPDGAADHRDRFSQGLLLLPRESAKNWFMVDIIYRLAVHWTLFRQFCHCRY